TSGPPRAVASSGGPRRREPLSRTAARRPARGPRLTSAPVRSSAFLRQGSTTRILMTAADTGWITDKRLHQNKLRIAAERWHAPLDQMWTAGLRPDRVRWQTVTALHGRFVRDYNRARDESRDRGLLTRRCPPRSARRERVLGGEVLDGLVGVGLQDRVGLVAGPRRSEERRGGKECGYGGGAW